MAKSPTEICNLSISWLGGNQLTSLDDDDSVEATLCRANYDLSRKAVLEEREWTFAIKRVELTPLAQAPSFGYVNAFQVPSDLLRTIQVYDTYFINYKEPPNLPHVIEGNKILADKSKIHLKYIYNLSNTVLFSALFDQCLAAHIGANIAIPLTENAEHQVRLFTLYEDKLQKAISSDSLQGSREHLATSRMERVRHTQVPID